MSSLISLDHLRVLLVRQVENRLKNKKVSLGQSFVADPVRNRDAEKNRPTKEDANTRTHLKQTHPLCGNREDARRKENNSQTSIMHGIKNNNNEDDNNIQMPFF